jgi:hypothetical protein
VVVLYAGQSATAANPLLAASHGPEAPSMAVTMFHGGDSTKLAAAVQRDGLVKADPLDREATVERIELKVNDHGDSSWSALDLGGHPDVMLCVGRPEQSPASKLLRMVWTRSLRVRPRRALPFGPLGETPLAPAGTAPNVR